jgi:hypothetical protein
MVLWLNQVGVLQPLVEQLHVREVVGDALHAVHGEEATVVESGRLVEVLVLNRLVRCTAWASGWRAACSRTGCGWTSPRSTTPGSAGCSTHWMG